MTESRQSQIKIPDHKKIIKYLSILQSNYDQLIIFLIEISKYSNNEGLIDEDVIDTILTSYNINYKDYPEDIKVKFKRYLNCFCITIKSSL